MPAEPSVPETNRPYPPPSNVISVLHRLRSRNLPEVIDSDYLRDSAIPEGTIGRTLFALRFLGLIDAEGGPTQALRSIHTSTDEEYSATLSGLVRQAYAEVFDVVDPAEDGQDRIINVFRRYTPASQRTRMVIFFLGMCRQAGIPTLDVPRQRAMSGTRQVVRPSPIRIGTRDATPPSRGKSKGAPSPDIAPALDGLIRSLPPQGTPLSTERRRQWLTMAEATLAFVYPEHGEGESAGEDERVEQLRGEEDEPGQ